MIKRPYVLSIAGFDPSSGAGITADIKTFEQHKVYGLGVATSVTFQNESSFEGVKWLTFDEIRSQLEVLKKQYQPKSIKIGLIESMERLSQVIGWIRKNWPEAFIIWDPILKASAGFCFHKPHLKELESLLSGGVDLVTPNIPEYKALFNDSKPYHIVQKYRCALLLKGGHSTTGFVTDYLYSGEFVTRVITSEKVKGDWQKHGTGCVLSSAIAACYAISPFLPDACEKAHLYVKKFIASDEGLLGFHPEVEIL